jgi:hypothetical protein
MSSKQILCSLWVVFMACALFASPASAATVASIVLTAAHTSLNAGASETLTAAAKDSTKHTVKVTFTWSSSSTGVLSITSRGVIKGLKPGTSTVRVAGGGKSATAVITVTAASIALTTPNKTLKIGDDETLVAVAKDTGGHAISGVKFTWKSSQTGIVHIRASGLASALDAGKSTITVTGGGRSATVAITVPVPSALSGVAAHGAAIAGAVVTLVDKKGAILATTTGSDGSYTLDTTGLKPPFMVKVQLGDTALYSVSADAETASIINVNPLTDLIIRSWYQVQGASVDAAFTTPATNPPPTPDQVQLISNVVVQVTALWLQQAGVDTTTYNPINTAFAVGDGADQVLDQTVVDTDNGTITITDGAGTTQDSTVDYGTGTITVDTSTTGPSGSSSSETGTVVATTTAMQTALTDITTTLSAFTGTVNAKGSALKASDLNPYLDAKLLNEGLNKALFADSTADQFRGLTLSFQILDITSLDTTNGLADVSFTASAIQGDQTQTQIAEFFFKQQSDGSWLFYGDQLPAKLGVQSEVRTSQGFITGDSGPDINVDIRPIKGAYTSITIDDGALGIFTDTALTKDGTEVDTYTPNPAVPGTTVEVDLDEFFANSGVLADLVPAGTPMTVTMTPATGSPKNYTVHTNAFTTESISITNLTGTTVTTDAHPGTPLHVEWTLPTTFAIAEVKLSATVWDGDQTQNTTNSCQSDGPILGITATSADVTFATSCSSNPVKQASLNLNVIGVNGERESVIYSFSDPL